MGLIRGVGTSLKIDTVTIPNHASLTPANQTRAMVDASCLDNAAAVFEASSLNNGVVKVRLKYDPDLHADLYAKFDGANHDFIATYACTPVMTDTFSGKIANWTPGEIDQKTAFNTVEFEVQVDGAYVREVEEEE